jgi:hydroxymethylpyrimidine pyrophosphatase-like HAD family hydrolase
MKGEKLMKLETIAVDFDGTLCESNWPGIGKPRYDIIDWIKDLKNAGHKIILWTCRDGMSLVEAIVWCADQGIFFDAVNDNLPDHKKRFGNNPRKIFADYYIDDKAIYPEIIPIILNIMKKKKENFNG